GRANSLRKSMAFAGVPFWAVDLTTCLSSSFGSAFFGSSAPDHGATARTSSRGEYFSKRCQATMTSFTPASQRGQWGATAGAPFVDCNWQQANRRRGPRQPAGGTLGVPRASAPRRRGPGPAGWGGGGCVVRG